MEKQIINGKDIEPLVALNYAIDALEAIYLVLEDGTPEGEEDAQFYAVLAAEHLKTLRERMKRCIETE